MSNRAGHRPDEPDSPVIETVSAHPLPASLEPLLSSYDRVLGDRDRFLWQWAHHLFPKFTLSCVEPDRSVSLADDKLLALVFVSILDDLAEKHGDRVTFEEAAQIPFDSRAVNPDREGVDREILALANTVWERFEPAIGGGPRAEEFADIVRFDLKQVCNAMDYSSLANDNLDFVNGPELQNYDAHNMLLFGFADVDLVHSPSFDRRELATLRRVLVRAQRMVRIGNWVSTWERELAEADFSSGVVVYALEHGIVSNAELEGIRDDPDPAAIERVATTIRDHDVEDVFIRRWEGELDAARALEGEFDSVDVGAYLDGIETIMDYHLASRGLK